MLSVSGIPMSLAERIRFMDPAVDVEGMAPHVVVVCPVAAVEHSRLEGPMHLRDHHSVHHPLLAMTRTNLLTLIRSPVLFLEPPLRVVLDESCGSRTSWIMRCIDEDAHNIISLDHSVHIHEHPIRNAAKTQQRISGYMSSDWRRNT